MQQLWRYYLGCGRGHSSDTTAERALEKGGGEKKGKGGESVSYLQIEILDTPLSLHIGRGAAFRFSASFANFIW